MNKVNCTKVMGYHVLSDNLSTLKIGFKGKIIINTINPHSYITAKNDKLFQSALESSDILIPDGSGIVLAAKLINNKSITKIAGADLHLYILKELNKFKGKVFYMGASKDTLEQIKEKIKSTFPNISVDSYSPPYKEKFSENENSIIIESVNRFNPNVLFIGMTAPKQEKWLYLNKDKLNFNVAASIGAVFDFYAGTVERPNRIWVNMHLEWLGRLMKQPKKMWRRNFISSPIFLLDLLCFSIGLKK